MTSKTHRQRNYLHGLDDAVVLCKGRKRHKWPSLIPGKAVPKTVDIFREGDGTFTVVEHCETGCGRWARRWANNRGIIDYSVRPQYGGGPGGDEARFLAPPGMGIEPGWYTDELAKRQAMLVTSGARPRHAEAPVVEFKAAKEGA